MVDVCLKPARNATTIERAVTPTCIVVVLPSVVMAELLMLDKPA